MNFDNSILKLCIFIQYYDMKKVCLVIHKLHKLHNIIMHKLRLSLGEIKKIQKQNLILNLLVWVSKLCYLLTNQN